MILIISIFPSKCINGVWNSVGRFSPWVNEFLVFFLLLLDSDTAIVWLRATWPTLTAGFKGLKQLSAQHQLFSLDKHTRWLPYSNKKLGDQRKKTKCEGNIQMQKVTWHLQSITCWVFCEQRTRFDQSFGWAFFFHSYKQTGKLDYLNNRICESIRYFSTLRVNKSSDGIVLSPWGNLWKSHSHFSSH